MKKKYIFLFIALALPGLVFIFLKQFGENEFNVQVYFKDGFPDDSICHTASSGPYHVPDSILDKISIDKLSVLRIAIVYPFVKDDLTEVMRIKNKYIRDSVDMVILTGIPNNPKSEIRQVFLGYSDFGNIVWCWLRVAEPWSVVLLDKKNQIRGYYDGTRRDEMDRLDLELSILLNKY